MVDGIWDDSRPKRVRRDTNETVNGVCTLQYVMMMTRVSVQECVIERDLKGSACPVIEANRKDLMQPPSKYFELRSWFEPL